MHCAVVRELSSFVLFVFRIHRVMPKRVEDLIFDRDIALINTKTPVCGVQSPLLMWEGKSLAPN